MKTLNWFFSQLYATERVAECLNKVMLCDLLNGFPETSEDPLTRCPVVLLNDVSPDSDEGLWDTCYTSVEFLYGVGVLRLEGYRGCSGQHGTVKLVHNLVTNTSFVESAVNGDANKDFDSKLQYRGLWIGEDSLDIDLKEHPLFGDKYSLYLVTMKNGVQHLALADDLADLQSQLSMYVTLAEIKSAEIVDKLSLKAEIL